MSVGTTPSPHLVIHASAGAGKTFQLATRYIRILATGESPERILATTFTRKAAAEILERVLGRLADAAADRRSLEELAAQLGMSLSSEGALAILEELVRNLHRLEIATLDSFFAALAARFPLELGLAPGWRIVDDSAAAELRSEAVRRLLERGSTADLVRLVRLLGKGEVSRSVNDQVQGVVAELHNLYLEAPRDSWTRLPCPPRLTGAEVEAAVAALRAIDPPAAWIARVLAKDIEVAESSDWKGFLRKGLAPKILDGTLEYRGRPIRSDVARAYRPLVDHAAAVLLGEVAHRTGAIHGLLERFDREYQTLKQRRRALRFDDITWALASARLLERLDAVHYRLDARLGHLLLDEFQDTSLLQWQVLRPLAEEIVSRGDGSRTLFCVGDVKQSIYDWRGGVAEIFHSVDRMPGVERRPLSRSWRSAQPVIDVVNQVFSGLESNPAVSGKYLEAVRAWCEEFEEHSTVKAGLEGHVRLVTASAAESAENRKRAAFRAAGAGVEEIRRKAPGSTVGVLVRENDSVARVIVELRRLGIPASEEGGVRLTDSPPVTAVLSLLSCADHPGDEVARFHVATSPLGPVVGLSRDGGDDEAGRLARDIRRRLVADGYGATIDRWVEGLAPACDARSLRRLLQLLDVACRWDAEATLRPTDFVSHVRSLKVEDPTASDVRVMTLHQAKGLEFDVVVLPELDRRFFTHQPPVLRDRPDPIGPIRRVAGYFGEETAKLHAGLGAFHEQYYVHHMRDVLSLLYVGMTRAVHALHMIVAPAAGSRKTARRAPGTYAGILRAALAPDVSAEPETVLYEHGDPQWYRRAAPPAPAVPALERGGTGEATVRLAPSRGRRRALPRESPSALEGKAVRLADRFRLDDEGRLRGSLIHAWLELVEWLDAGEPDGPDDAALRRRAREAVPGAAAMVVELIPEFRGMLGNGAVRHVLCRRPYLEELAGDARGAEVEVDVERERRFALRDGDRILTGSFDRLVTVRWEGRVVAADVVDFKTDAAPADRIDALVDTYRAQIEAYRAAASRLKGLEPDRVAARLVFVTAGRVVTL